MGAKATISGFFCIGTVLATGLVVASVADASHAATQHDTALERQPFPALSISAQDLQSLQGSFTQAPLLHVPAQPAFRSFTAVPRALLRRERSLVSRLPHVGGYLQCVAFARAESGIGLVGNAADWWAHAAGVYERGSEPEPGSVLNFRPNPRMRLGHVAVVTGILNSREITIDHANWANNPAGRGVIRRAVHVVDVSPDNDWTAVRVQLGSSGDYGSIYPTFGFIYDRPEGSPPPLLEIRATAPLPLLNPVPSDLRPPRERVTAELPMRGGFGRAAEAQAGRPGLPVLARLDVDGSRNLR